MVNATYALKLEDQQKLVSYAVRYKGVRTSIDERQRTMTVWTTWNDNDEPTSIADCFALQLVAEGRPEMPDEEYRRRFKGEPI
jgi:hypothetical protein